MSEMVFHLQTDQRPQSNSQSSLQTSRPRFLTNKFSSPLVLVSRPVLPSYSKSDRTTFAVRWSSLLFNILTKGTVKIWGTVLIVLCITTTKKNQISPMQSTLADQKRMAPHSPVLPPTTKPPQPSTTTQRKEKEAKRCWPRWWPKRIPTPTPRRNPEAKA